MELKPPDDSGKCMYHLLKTRMHARTHTHTQTHTQYLHILLTECALFCIILRLNSGYLPKQHSLTFAVDVSCDVGNELLNISVNFVL
jgi:hypothetical protein